jgi:site-specific DNA recombinase
LDVSERQRIVRLLVKEIVVADDAITIRHSIPTPSGPPAGGEPTSPRPGVGDTCYLLRSGSNRAALRRPLIHWSDQTVFHHPGIEKRPDEFEHTPIGQPRGDARHQTIMIDSIRL